MEANFTPEQKDSIKVMKLKTYTNWEVKFYRVDGETDAQLIDRINKANDDLALKYPKEVKDE